MGQSKYLQDDSPNTLLRYILSLLKSPKHRSLDCVWRPHLVEHEANVQTRPYPLRSVLVCTSLQECDQGLMALSCVAFEVTLKSQRTACPPADAILVDPG